MYPEKKSYFFAIALSQILTVVGETLLFLFFFLQNLQRILLGLHMSANLELLGRCLSVLSFFYFHFDYIGISVKKKKANMEHS